MLFRLPGWTLNSDLRSAIYNIQLTNLKAKNKISVLLVTGFLGAGKTTFINEVIRSHQHLRLALVENEFGERSIDSDLIVGMKADNIFELSNGCICCTISDEFSLSMLEFAKKLDQIDFLIIETTGIADLAEVIRPFYADNKLQEYYQLAGSVCIADAANYNELIKLPPQQKQIIFSDLVILNKIGDVCHETKEGLKRSIKAYNPSVGIEETNYGKLPSFSLTLFTDDIQEKLENKLQQPVMFPFVESATFKTFTHRFEGKIDMDKFKYWFDYFASLNQREIYRIKGILFPKENSSKIIVQSVGGATSYNEGSFITPSEEKINTLVFIGKKIDFERITYELESYLSSN